MKTGTVITYDKNALRRWQAAHRRRSGHTQTPAEFSATIARLAARYPDKVKPH